MARSSNLWRAMKNSGTTHTRPQKYRFVKKLGSGAFADVIQAENVQTHEMVAIKRIKETFKNVEEVQKIREIQALKALQSVPTVINLREVLFDRESGRLALVTELMNCNLYDIISKRSQPLPDKQVRFYAFEILSGIRQMHKVGYMHRDIKPENVLILKVSANFLLHQVKIADVGSCRPIGSTLPYTEYISTRWYRSPSTLLSDGVYGPEMDVFSAGCMIFESEMLFPLFPGKDELDEINRIHAVLGTPDPAILKRIRKGVKNNPIKCEFASVKGCGIQRVGKSIKKDLVQLLQSMLEYDGQRRITAEECLKMRYFDSILDILAEALEEGADEAYIKYLEEEWRSARDDYKTLMRHTPTSVERELAEKKKQIESEQLNTSSIIDKSLRQQKPGSEIIIKKKKSGKPKYGPLQVVTLDKQLNTIPKEETAYLPAPLPTLTTKTYKTTHKTYE